MRHMLTFFWIKEFQGFDRKEKAILMISLFAFGLPQFLPIERAAGFSWVFCLAQKVLFSFVLQKLQNAVGFQKDLPA